MGKWIGGICVFLGVVCILSAIGFVAYNRWEADSAEQIAQDVIQTNGGAAAPMGGGINPQIMQADSIGGMPKKEHSVVTKARQQSNEASQPDSDGVVNTRR